MRPIDRTHIERKYKGKWIALRTDGQTVIASGTSLRSVLAVARKKGVQSPIIIRVPTPAGGSSLPAWCKVFDGLSDQELTDLNARILPRANFTRTD